MSTTPEIRSIDRVLVANRGEIAVRVIRACRELGLGTIAVCSEVDRMALHAQLADQVVVIGPASPTESYLCGDRLLEVARETDADAIHPGYGFLAENADFSRACAEAGVIFIGPGPEVISQMGEKTAARAAMEKAGVPVVPGALLPLPAEDGSFDAPEVLRICSEVGFPLMIKASFGGGGKGMRLVEESRNVVKACEAAAREAKGAFGDGTVYVEKYIEHPRHVEFQVFGDAHGNAVHLFERECSIQRRHQKIIEETPSPALNPELRAEMGQAAVSAVMAVGYQGAGTVEFLLDQDGGFYLVTGVDLVRAQIHVAEGRPLPWAQDDLTSRGHAIECRIYAEDPAANFMPSLGEILLMHEPTGPGVRLDSGVRAGDEVSMHYDPLLAKLCVLGETRQAAIERALGALREFAILGVTTNVAYLMDILRDEAFAAGDLHTGLLEERLPAWTGEAGTDTDLALAVAAVAEADRLKGGPVTEGEPVSNATPWDRLGHFRLNGMD